MDQVVAQALTTYNQLTTKPVVQLAANVNDSASNLSSSNGAIEFPATPSLEVAAVNGNGNGNGNGKSASK
jgi:UDP-galactopyranose mutase